MLLRSLAFLAVAWILVAVLTWAFQRRLMYIPVTDEPPPASAFPGGGEHVAFVTEDGIRLGGWFLPAENNRDGTTILVFNGNAGDRTFRAPLAEALSRDGVSVLLFDYRGYGGNEGRPTERGLLSDARAARASLASREDVVPDRIVYFGESLGCGVAVRLAEERPPAAMVLRSPFTSLADVGQRHFFFLPVKLFMWDQFRCAERIARVGCPILVLAGDRDRIVPPVLSRRLFEAAREPKRFVLIPGADHNDAELLFGERLLEEVRSFLDETVRTTAEPTAPGQRQ